MSLGLNGVGLLKLHQLLLNLLQLVLKLLNLKVLSCLMIWSDLGILYGRLQIRSWCLSLKVSSTKCQPCCKAERCQTRSLTT